MLNFAREKNSSDKNRSQLDDRLANRMLGNVRSHTPCAMTFRFDMKGMSTADLEVDTPSKQTKQVGWVPSGSESNTARKAAHNKVKERGDTTARVQTRIRVPVLPCLDIAQVMFIGTA